MGASEANARGHGPLTSKAVQALAAGPRDYKRADSAGLYVFVTTKGHKSWRMKYVFGGKERRVVFGSFPETSLAQARLMRDGIKAELRAGRDPRLAAAKGRLLGSTSAEDTFEARAREWHALQVPRWKPVHAADVLRSLERDLFPAIGAFAIPDIDERMLLAALRLVERRGAVESAGRLRQRADAVFRFARAAGVRNDNPADIVRGALAPKPKKRRWPAVVDIGELRRLIATVDAAGASPVTRLASRFLALTAQRPGMVRGALWSEFSGIDWSRPGRPSPEAEWRIPAARMKLELHLADDAAFDHVVPLPQQAVEVLHAVRMLTGRGPLPFCSSRASHEPMSENAIGYLYNREGYKGRHVPHGWRSSFSTILNERNERLHFDSDRAAGDRLVIDLMLAHVPSGVSGSELRYNRAAFMPRRRELAQLWADMLFEGAAPPENLLQGRRRRIG